MAREGLENDPKQISKSWIISGRQCQAEESPVELREPGKGFTESSVRFHRQAGKRLGMEGSMETETENHPKPLQPLSEKGRPAGSQAIIQETRRW